MHPQINRSHAVQVHVVDWFCTKNLVVYIQTEPSVLLSDGVDETVGALAGSSQQRSLLTASNDSRANEV